MKINVNTDIAVDVAALSKSLSVDELVYLLDAVARRFDQEFGDRRKLAEAFAEGTTEIGARFLAEVISCTIYRG